MIKHLEVKIPLSGLDFLLTELTRVYYGIKIYVLAAV
jgi:hypothetical protein